MITVEKSIARTREFLGLDNSAGLSHITKQFFKADASALITESGTDFPTVLFGSALACGQREGKPTFEFCAAIRPPAFPDSINEEIVCGVERWWGYQNQWSAIGLDIYCGESKSPENRIFQFTLSNVGDSDFAKNENIPTVSGAGPKKARRGRSRKR